MIAGLATGLVIVLLGLVALLIRYDTEKRKRRVAEKVAEEARKAVEEARKSVEEAKKAVSPEAATEKILQEAKAINEGTDEILAATLSPISSNPVARKDLIARLNRLGAELTHLDARIRQKDAIKRAQLEEEIRQAEKKVKELELQDAPKEEIDKAKKELDALHKQRKEQFK